MFLLKVGNVIGVSHDVCEKREKKLFPSKRALNSARRKKSGTHLSCGMNLMKSFEFFHLFEWLG